MGQHEIRWSSDLHLVNVVRRRKLSRGERRCIVWAPAARSGTRSPSRPRNHLIFTGSRRLYSFSLDDVGHAVTGCTAVTTRTPAARGWPRLCQYVRSVHRPAALHWRGYRLRSWCDSGMAGEPPVGPVRWMLRAYAVRGLSAIPGLFFVTVVDSYVGFWEVFGC